MRARDRASWVVTPITLQGPYCLLYGIFVDRAYWKCGVGRVLFGAAAARTKALKPGAHDLR